MLNAVIIFMVCISCIPYYFKYEKKKPQTRESVVLAVMIALTVASRMLFAFSPGFKPVSAMAVSYTHLDVYKRQVCMASCIYSIDHSWSVYCQDGSCWSCLLYTSQNASESLNLILMEKPFPLKKNQKSQNQTTVSQDYTSDVYKRQEQERCG